MNKISQTYDLEERTAKFGEDVIAFCNFVSKTPVSTPLINQVVRSATSIGANYVEANGASSKKDFRAKIHLCKKEAKETRHWLRMLSVAITDTDELLRLKQEAYEITLIFGKIASSLNK